MKIAIVVKKVCQTTNVHSLKGSVDTIAIIHGHTNIVVGVVRSGENKMEIEIIFISSNTPKKMECVATYTKAGFFCVQRADGMIIRYPLMNIFQVANFHGPHVGSSISDWSVKEAVSND